MFPYRRPHAANVPDADLIDRLEMANRFGFLVLVQRELEFWVVGVSEWEDILSQ